MTTNETPPITKAESWKMFNRIAGRYDLLNRVLSFGLDRHWRKRLAAFLPARSRLVILDLATGTADVLISIVKNNPVIQKAYGIDMAEQMLAIGEEKIKRQGLTGRIVLMKGDANQLPFPDHHFDAVTIAFGIRNMPHMAVTLKEIVRVLKPQGRVLILEFSKPENPLLKIGHRLYLRWIVPLVGGMLSGDFAAYKYLNETIERFPYGLQFCRILRQVGLQNAMAAPLMGGVASIYTADQSTEPPPGTHA